ncbi:DUF2275 domain-containing protein [Thermoanaerobacterium thermosaccharolyticum]|uniref:Anti-sigma-W factor RsiW n=1 Tax=Thermoanaerobacterium thermosaccharolyticum M0795 TaxID=698948 RepID=L0IIF4_THETR|nr:DUF2275 domain-containing protein [Thermoanaerobacterium thermosaccharolyticum]AGB18021.1 putative integral membrane protein (DUF2275) [Thermoanaerobacterium thermosaccharolyticum M0795]
MCFDEGTLQSYLDGEIDESLKEQIKKHLDTCEKCSSRLNELKNLNSFLDKALKTSSIDLNEAWENLNKKINKEERGVFHMFKKYKKYIAAAAAIAVIIASVALPPVQKAEAEILSLFRLNNFKAVTITPDDLQDIKNKFYQAGNKEIDLKQYGDIKVIGDDNPYNEFSLDNINELKTYVGYNFKMPQDVKHINVRKNQSIEFKLNIENINSLIKTLGGDKLLPVSLNGKTFKINLNNIVDLYSNDDKDKYKSYNLEIMKTPEIIVPDGINIDQVRDAVINMPFLPDDIKNQIASIKDWKNTLPMPVSNKDNVKDVTINGNKGIAITTVSSPSNDPKKYTYTELAWNENGITYIMNSNMSPDELIKIAESMR